MNRRTATKVSMPEQTLRAVRKVFRFPVLGRLWGYIVAVAVYSAVVVLVDKYLIEPAAEQVRRDRSAEAVVAGIIFGWLMSFRTQTAYARWWDGRSLWGQLVNDSRNLMLKAAAFACRSARPVRTCRWPRPARSFASFADGTAPAASMASRFSHSISMRSSS